MIRLFSLITAFALTLGMAAAAEPVTLRFGVIDNKRTHEFADNIIKTFDVRTTGPKAEARSLSGGNLQKFLVGREVLQVPGVARIPMKPPVPPESEKPCPSGVPSCTR